MSAWRLLLRRAQRTPYLVIPGCLALLNGYWHKLKFRLFFKDFRAGSAFRVYGSFRVLGFGSVRLGDNCFVDSRTIKAVTFKTIVPGARITAGDNTGFNGTTIICHDAIDIQEWCNIADAYIVDSPVHRLSADRRNVPAEAMPTYPVKLERNVWVSTRVVISHGVTIGRNSVVGAMSLVRKDIEANTFYAGNPARKISDIPPALDALPPGVEP